MSHPVTARLLQLLARTVRRPNPYPARKNPHRFVPDLVSLEDRATPSAAIARDDWADTDGSNPVSVAILANDSPSQPPKGTQTLPMRPGSILIRSMPSHGKIKVNRVTGTVTYTAANGFTGTDTFQYRARDSRGVLSNVATVNVQVNRPTAADDWTDTDGTNPVAINVLENDTDPDGNQHINHPGAVSLASPPSHGTVTLDAAANTFTYTASANFMGTDRVTYIVTDDAGASSAAGNGLVQVTRPTAADDLAAFDGTNPVVIDVLENDTDPDGNQHILPGSVTVTTQPQHGTTSVNPVTGEVTYTANAGFSGTDKFQYTLADDAGATSAPGTVTVVGATSTGLNDDFADTDGTNPVTVNVLANDVGVRGMVPHSVRISRMPTNG